MGQGLGSDYDFEHIHAHALWEEELYTNSSCGIAHLLGVSSVVFVGWQFASKTCVLLPNISQWVFIIVSGNVWEMTDD